MPEITVIVAGGNPAMRIKLVKALEANRRLKVIAQVSDLPATYTAAEALEPDVVMVAHELTRLPEFSLVRSLFRALNSQWIAVDHRGLADSTAQLPVLAGNHPAIDTAQGLDVIGAQVIAALRMAPSHPIPPAPSAPFAASHPGKLILIGASTGGVDALLTVLSALPENCPPVAVVQHTGQGFSESLIRLLARRCVVAVEAAQNEMELRVGRVCVAAGCGGHMRLRRITPYRIALETGPPVSGHFPSVDALFNSAVPAATNIVAALLTGMGRDGAEGLLALRRAGAMTIGQDENSSVVYGMPKVAWDIGAVKQQLPLGEIAGAIMRACALVSQEGRKVS